MTGNPTEELFNLAPLTKLSPEAIVPREEGSRSDERFAMFMLTLSLFFNDAKGIMLMFDPINDRTKPKTDGVSPHAGQWAGLDMQRHRLIAAMLHELLELLKAFKEEATSERMAALLKKVHPNVRGNWSALLEKSIHNPGPKVKGFASALAQIRANMTFHYDQPIPLMRGFRRHFYEQPPDDSNTDALCSFGNTMERTRFYYADAAVRHALWKVQGEDKSRRFLKLLEHTVNDANEAIWAILVAYLKPAVRHRRRLGPREGRAT